MELLLLQKILLALAIGALIGIEREKRRTKEAVFAGVRTFMFTCLFGLLTGYLSGIFSSYLPVYIGLATVASIAVASYILESKGRMVGLTTRTAFILSFIIGVIIFYENYPYIISLSLGVLITLFLLSKESLHRFARGLKKKEIRDATVFAIVAFIILPLLPNTALGPSGTINLRIVWLIVVVILGIGFFAYVALKTMGAAHGLALTGLFGGFAGSTQLALVMANNSKKHKGIVHSSTFAVAVASSIMFFRQVGISLLFNISLAAAIIPFSILGGLGMSLSYMLWKKSRREVAKVSIGSPLTLKPALAFMFYLLLVMLVVGFVKDYFGFGGLYSVALLSGLVDVDAITISLATLSATGLPLQVAVNGMLIASLMNTGSKWLLIKWFGSREMEKEVRNFFVLLLIACAAVLFLQLA